MQGPIPSIKINVHPRSFNMTYNVTVPNASQSPSLLPGQANANFTRLKELINADHVFNDTMQTTDGVHRQCTLIDRADPVSLPSGTDAILYSWEDASGQSQLKLYNGTSIFQITPGIVAAVNFDGRSSTPDVNRIRGTALNVSGIVRNGAGLYTITFSSAMPDANYIISGMGMRNEVGAVSAPCVLGDTTYSNSITAGSVKILFAGGGTNGQDVIMGSIIIMRY